MDLISSKGKSFAVMTKGPLVFIENDGRTAVDIGFNDGELVDVEYRYMPSIHTAGDLLFHCPGRTWSFRVYGEKLWQFNKDKPTIELPFSQKKWKVQVLESNNHHIVFTMV